MRIPVPRVGELQRARDVGADEVALDDDTVRTSGRVPERDLVVPARNQVARRGSRAADPAVRGGIARDVSARRSRERRRSGRVGPEEVPLDDGVARAVLKPDARRAPVDDQALDRRVGRADVEADGAAAEGRAVDLDPEHRVEPLRRVVRVRRGARLRVAVDRDRRADRRKRRVGRDRLDAGARDVERDRIRARVRVGVQDGLAQRPGARIGDGRHGVGVRQEGPRGREGGQSEGSSDSHESLLVWIARGRSLCRRPLRHGTPLPRARAGGPDDRDAADHCSPNVFVTKTAIWPRVAGTVGQ